MNRHDAATPSGWCAGVVKIGALNGKAILLAAQTHVVMCRKEPDASTRKHQQTLFLLRK